jgi:ribA/ribD-fused uncharacterized protein
MKPVKFQNDEITVPYFAIHDDGKIYGFFGPFRFLSNFYILDNGVFMEDLFYPSVEHAYQAAKWPYNMRNQFVSFSPSHAKKMGAEAPKFNAKKWNKMKVSLMSGLCYQKFKNNPKLKDMLLMTEDAKLEERNNWGDVFWGTNPTGEGENQLGKILMDVRHNLKLDDKKELW